MVFSHIILFGIVLGTAFSNNYTVFVILRVLTGAVCQVCILNIECKSNKPEENGR